MLDFGVSGGWMVVGCDSGQATVKRVNRHIKSHYRVIQR